MSWGGGALLSQTFIVSKRTTFFSTNTNIMQNILFLCQRKSEDDWSLLRYLFFNSLGEMTSGMPTGINNGHLAASFRFFSTFLRQYTK